MKRSLIAVAMMLVATFAFANGGGHGAGGGDNRRDDGGGANLLVAADGTAFIVQRITDATTDVTTTRVVAISPSGATSWTATLPANSGHGDLVLSGTNLIAVSTPRAADGTAATASTLTAISTASGATAWTLTLPGVAQDVRPFSGGTYVIVTSTTTRSLVAVSNSGAILFTTPLT
jgi:hypothetical protein